MPLLASSPFPSGCRSPPAGRTVNLLIPLYLVIAAGTIAQLLPRLLAGRANTERPGRGPGRDQAARYLPWLLLRGRPALRAADGLLRRPGQGAREHRCSSTCPSGCCSCSCAMSTGRPELLRRCLGLAVVAGGPVRRGRLRRVRPQVPVPEPEGGRGQPVRQLLPRQLGLLRPEHLRALPGARDDRRHDRRAVERRRTRPRSAALVLAWLLAGLVTSFSQSSIAALLLGLAVLAASAGICAGRSTSRSRSSRSRAPSCCSPRRAFTSA